MPKDMQAWREINRLYAEHFKNLDQNSKYYEIWNEPDLNPVFLPARWNSILKFIARAR